jgi:hypothetical protein
MAGLNGSNASVKIVDDTVARLANWSVDLSKPLIAIEPFGATTQEVLGVGVGSITGRCSGWLDIVDTDGQLAMKTAYDGGTAISGVRFYVNADDYYDAGSTLYLTSLAIGATQGEAISVEFGFVTDTFDLVEA